MAEEIFNALIKNDKDAATNSFVDVIQQKLNTAMDVRRVGMTSNIFNNTGPVVEEDKVVVEEDTQLDEKVSADKFVKGGNDKITQSEVDSLLGKIYNNSKLTKDLIKNKSYRDGESNSKAKNSNKKDTIDFHLFQLGQQVELSRQ